MEQGDEEGVERERLLVETVQERNPKDIRVLMVMIPGADDPLRDQEGQPDQSQDPSFLNEEVGGEIENREAKDQHQSARHGSSPQGTCVLTANPGGGHSFQSSEGGRERLRVSPPAVSGCGLIERKQQGAYLRRGTENRRI